MEETNDKFLQIIKVITLIIIYSIIGVFLILFIGIKNVDAATLTLNQVTCSWNTSANTIRTETCTQNDNYNIGGYTNYINLLPNFTSSYGSQLWTISTTLDLYVEDYGNQDNDYIMTPLFQLYQNNQVQQVQNLSRTIVAQRADCSDPNNCWRIRTFNFTFQWQGDINGITIQNLSSYYNRGDCGWLQDNPQTCTSSYPRIHFLEMTATYNDAQEFEGVQDSIDNQTTIINGAINQSTQQIEQNQNMNTDRIIDSGVSNSQAIINNQNANNQALQDNIDSQFNSCETYNFVYSTIKIGERERFLKNDGTTTRDVNWEVSDYYGVEKNKTYTIKSVGNNPSYCLYGTDKSLISCQSYGNRNTINVTPSTNGFIRFSISKNSPTFSFSGEYCYNRLDRQNEQQQQQNDYLTDPTVDSSAMSGFQVNANYGPVSGIIIAPLQAIQSILNQTCSDLVIPLPYLNNKNLTLPCLTPIYQRNFSTILALYQTIITGIVAYWICLNIFHMVHGFTDPTDDKIEVVDL